MKRELRRLVKALVLENAAKYLADDFIRYGIAASTEEQNILDAQFAIEDTFIKECDMLVSRLRNEAQRWRERMKE